MNEQLTKPLAAASNRDLAEVGGKNASLGEMIRNLKNAGIRVSYREPQYAGSGQPRLIRVFVVPDTGQKEPMR